MLRYALYDCHSTVTLNDELKFVAAYLRLAELRLPNEKYLHTELNAADCGSLQMAPLLFINIIENSIKHTAPLSANDYIDIRITAKDGTVTCVCSNPYHPEPAQPHKGLGLRNLRRRLELLYGANAQLTIDKSANRFTVTMQVNISQPPAFSEALRSIDHSTT
ncbi:MAG: histidine kinase [Muribaculaceae bacterium]|nr:histidine kinase [Muribaculaceae bacterium]